MVLACKAAQQAKRHAEAHKDEACDDVGEPSGTRGAGRHAAVLEVQGTKVAEAQHNQGSPCTCAATQASLSVAVQCLLMGSRCGTLPGTHFTYPMHKQMSRH